MPSPPAAASAETLPRPQWATWSLLWAGVIAASVAAILIRYAGEARPLAISFWRCAVGAAVLVPLARPLVNRGWPEVRAAVVAGIFLALHFASWISSVELTTVASSVLLVSTTPVFVAATERFFMGRRIPRWGWAGIAIALGGTALVAGADLGGSSLAGNLLALGGAAGAAGYFLAGASARRVLGIFEFSVVTYGTAAVLLLAACVAGGIALGGYAADTWWAITGLIVGPQLLGHTVINLVLRDIDTTSVSVAVMSEPIVATALAFFLFSEAPPALAVPGGAAILVGIYVVTRVQQTPAVVFE